MDNNDQIMEYTQEFKDFLTLAKQCDQTYVGHGNPNAPILIVANEPGVANDDFIEHDLKKNRGMWEANLPDSSMDKVDVMFDGDDLVWERFNPLWPYKGQRCNQIKVKKEPDGSITIVNASKRPTSRSWLQYQKLVNLICGKNIEVKGELIDFFNHAFITDFSAVYGKSSKDIDPEKRGKSIIQRLPLFGSSFISRFPVIIVASGHYIRDIDQLNDLRKVFQGFSRVELVNDKLGWRNIHKSEDGKRILVHTQHFASAISDDYLKAIAKECSFFLNR